MGYRWGSVGHRWTIGGLWWAIGGPSMKGPQRLVTLVETAENFTSTGIHALIIFDNFWKVVTSKIISKVLQNEDLKPMKNTGIRSKVIEKPVE